jgi:hypothetical protein
MINVAAIVWLAKYLRMQGWADGRASVAEMRGSGLLRLVVVERLLVERDDERLVVGSGYELLPLPGCWVVCQTVMASRTSAVSTNCSKRTMRPARTTKWWATRTSIGFPVALLVAV